MVGDWLHHRYAFAIAALAAFACGRLNFESLPEDEPTASSGSSDAAAPRDASPESSSNGDSSTNVNGRVDSAVLMGLEDAASEFAGILQQVFPTFADDCPMSLSGIAVCEAEVLSLTTSTQYTASAAFLPDPVTLEPTTSFHSEFRFHLAGDGGDGLAFVMQNDPDGAAAIGHWGEYLGYSGLGNSAKIDPCIAVEIDTYFNPEFDIDDNHLGVIRSSDQLSKPYAQQTVPFPITSAEPRYVWVDYDGDAQRLRVSISETDAEPPSPLLDVSLDVYGELGGVAYFGFTAGTGEKTNVHAIDSWTLEVY